MNIARKLMIGATLLLSGSALCLGQGSSPTKATSPAAASSPASNSPAANTAGVSPGTNTAPYTEGSVWEITMVKTKPGMDDDYIKGLAKNYKLVMEEEKKANLVLSYKIFLGDASSPGDYNMLLMVEYKNMAALDGFRDKAEPIAQKILGSEDQRREMSVKRADIREILGNKTMREITLK